MFASFGSVRIKEFFGPIWKGNMKIRGKQKSAQLGWEFLGQLLLKIGEKQNAKNCIYVGCGSV